LPATIQLFLIWYRGLFCFQGREVQNSGDPELKSDHPANGKMKTKLQSLFIGLALLAGTHEAGAQTAQFFRIVGPTAVTITQFRADYWMVWSGASPGATYTVQISTALAGGGGWVDYNQIVAGGSISTNVINAFNPPAGMVLIPAGVFTIGDTLDGESNAIPTNVTVSAFYMDVNLVSSNQWAGVYTYATSQGYVFANTGQGKAANYPVVTVDWFDCVKWSNARSQQAGLMPVYYMDAGFMQVFTNGDGGTMVYANWGANGYRLPTEAEWEKAARGGLSGQRFPWGDTISESQANYYAYPNPPNSGGYGYDLSPYTGWNRNFDTGSYYTSPVGYFAPNGYGLNDMAGNVFEWCWDSNSGQPYPAGSPYLGGTDPRGPVGLLGYRVLRGGDWSYDASYARCAFRGLNDPGGAGGVVGFRCVKGL
jgi:formylglycine-generating enzyme required for sulfatase activity